MTEQDWCPENDGAYRAEMAERHRQIECSNKINDELLEALEEARQPIVDGFRAILGNMPEDKMAGIKKIDAAIAKAKGEDQ